MVEINDDVKRECLEMLVEQNPMLDKDSILALFNDIQKNARDKNPDVDLKEFIKEHKY